MWIDEADGFAEIFRGYLPYYLLVALPILIIIAPASPVAASHEFTVYRMQQHDLHTVPHGCRSASFNLEGRSLSSWSTSRHCVVARIQDMTIDQFVSIRSKAGALLLVLPKNATLLSDEDIEHIQLLELAMTQQEINSPVYLAHWTPEFEDILGDLQDSFVTDDKSATALEAMVNGVSSNGYQIVVSAPTPAKLESTPVTIHGKLTGTGPSTIVIHAHYDASGLAPELALGADDNASGAAALLELARVMSRLYAAAEARAAPSLVFLLAAGGRALNYLPTKKWLEDQLDSSDATLLQDVSFALCLDRLSSSPSLFAHVSRPPAPGSPARSLVARLRGELLHKKINLADEVLAWPHERFSIRRMSALTVSASQSHKDPGRSSILDTPSEAKLKHLVSNIVVIARALASHVYNLTEEVNDEDAQLYDEYLGVDESAIRLWYYYFASQARAPQIITTTPPNAGITAAFERVLSRYMDTTVSSHALDKREPEYTLYGPTKATLFVYSVKPAVFDLILTLAIIAYLSAVYFAIQLFPAFYKHYAKLVTGKAKVH